MKYALKVRYIGKNYYGSQIQFENGVEIDKPTIQGILEKAICTVTGDKITETNKRPIKTVFSGRTDKGVNSKGQVFHFRTDKHIVASKFVYSVNEILPPDISIRDLEVVDEGFHAQKSAKRRYYRYEFINRRNKDAFDGDLPRVKYEINIKRMQKSLNYLLGEHDFSSFKSSGTLNPSTVCFIEKAECKQLGDDRVVIDIIGNRFLYNMVRTIVGTLLEIEGHNLPPEHMKNVLEAKDRRKAGQTASPYGLTLLEVQY
ncbi:tRNA pseudouridine(38-40) synthase TruA [bacterium]|uniref:tRNA pseudouridine synthase A n=1 Tax=Candidatus Scatenecus faecavium TaxID=2840915 RepID=A0A9D1K3M4_9BACT|nr:tRNA pseudouridine(38-40) synthase TruA [bacterium]HIS82193.1 tRNA pseudouridine(38-40) synthase TruA [Candidatus Scatenecus faecavium]